MREISLVQLRRRRIRFTWQAGGLILLIAGSLLLPAASAPPTPETGSTKGRFPREVELARQAARNKLLGTGPSDRLMARLRREHRGTDVLAYQLPGRTQPVRVAQAGPGAWKLSQLTARKLGLVPVLVVLGDAGAKPAPGGQLFVLALVKTSRPVQTRIVLMFTTPRPLGPGTT